MAKGYWIARVDVSDAEAYSRYAAAAGPAYAAYGGRLLVRGGTYHGVEGEARSRNVVIEFPSYDEALACYRSDAYLSARENRLGAATIDLVVVQGYDE